MVNGVEVYGATTQQSNLVPGETPKAGAFRRCLLIICGLGVLLVAASCLRLLPRTYSLSAGVAFAFLLTVLATRTLGKAPKEERYEEVPPPPPPNPKIYSLTTQENLVYVGRRGKVDVYGSGLLDLPVTTFTYPSDPDFIPCDLQIQSQLFCLTERGELLRWDTQPNIHVLRHQTPGITDVKCILALEETLIFGGSAERGGKVWLTGQECINFSEAPRILRIGPKPQTTAVAFGRALIVCESFERKAVNTGYLKDFHYLGGDLYGVDAEGTLLRNPSRQIQEVLHDQVTCIAKHGEHVYCAYGVEKGYQILRYPDEKPISGPLVKKPIHLFWLSDESAYRIHYADEEGGLHEIDCP